MTDEQRQELKEAKEAATERLAAVDLRRYRLRRIDRRIETYAKGVIAHPERHNLWEQLALLRFFDMFGKYGINVGEVRAFFTFYEALEFPGKKGPERFKLTPVQAFQFCNIFGFWDGDRRVVREVCLFVPRKFSKTTSTASLAVYDLMFGEANAEAYVGANSEQQAKKCFDIIRYVMLRLDPNGRHFATSEERIRSVRKDRSAVAQCLTASARTKDGLNASTVIMDEFSQAKDNLLLTVLTTSMGVRSNPLTVIITTASDVLEGPFFAMLKGYKDLLLGKYTDDSVFAHLFEPDADDAEDDPQTWAKVQPHLGVTVGSDFYDREYRSALRNGADAMLAFRTKLLNVYAVNERRSWISATFARDISRHLPIESIKNRPPAFVSIDLSESGDFSAVSVGIVDEAKYNYYFHTVYFFPEGALTGHENEQLYRKWAADGHLRLTKGSVIDYDEIAEYVLSLNRYVEILQIGYDPWRSLDIINTLRAAISDREGNPDNVLIPVRQNLGNFTAPVQSFEHGAKTGHVYINDNPINFYCFGNAVLRTDSNENMKPEKRQEGKRIDGVITMLMCQRLIIDYDREY